MRIEASNLIAAQATPVQRPKPPVQRAPEAAKPAFDLTDFSKTAKPAGAETPAHPQDEPKSQELAPVDYKQAKHMPGGQHQRQGSHVDIKV